jgi:proteasome accessory factor A
MRRATPFSEVVRHLTPFFISRQIFTGAGRLGIGQDGRTPQYQLSQRADFFEVEVGLETTLKRPIINTRDEPHADPEKYRRLHVIVGDANLSDTATYLKMGTTAIVLAMIEDGFLGPLDAMPLEPVNEMHRVSHDTELSHEIALNGGRRWTALQMQQEFLERAWEYCDSRWGSQYDEQTKDVLTKWGAHLDALAGDPATVSDTVDWVAKLQLLEGYVRRDNLSWDDARLALVDLQYADIRPDKGLAARLEQRGRLQRMFDDPAVQQACDEPPTDTRAYFRGRCMSQYPQAVAAASWDSVVFDLPERDTLLRVPTLEPTRGTKDHVGDLLDTSPDASALIDALTDG